MATLTHHGRPGRGPRKSEELHELEPAETTEALIRRRLAIPRPVESSEGPMAEQKKM
jgi:hypothetical protein